MVAELTQNTADWGRIQGALDEIRACHEESTSFFSGMFEELDSLCQSLLSQEQQLEKQTVMRQNEHAVSEAVVNDRWETLLKQFEDDRAEIRHAEQVVQEQLLQLTAIATDLASAQNEFQTVYGELAQHSAALEEVDSQTLSASPEPEADIKHKIRDLEQQQSSLEKERAVLETELETVRRRAAEMADSLAEQKRLAAQQQSQWTEDLRQMRIMLESLIREFTESRRQTDAPPRVAPASTVGAVASADPVLESVLAQFEILQQDRLRRRAGNVETSLENK